MLTISNRGYTCKNAKHSNQFKQLLPECRRPSIPSLDIGLNQTGHPACCDVARKAEKLCPEMAGRFLPRPANSHGLSEKADLQ
jgi:hypothetical protein